MFREIRNKEAFYNTKPEIVELKKRIRRLESEWADTRIGSEEDKRIRKELEVLEERLKSLVEA